jgi:hypothetical protein
MTPKLYEQSLFALDTIPAILGALDLDALLAEANRRGAAGDVAFLTALTVIKAHLPDRHRPRDGAE